MVTTRPKYVIGHFPYLIAVSQDIESSCTVWELSHLVEKRMMEEIKCQVEGYVLPTPKVEVMGRTHVANTQEQALSALLA